MSSLPVRARHKSAGWTASHEILEIRTEEPVQWIDLTDRLAALVWRQRLYCGVVHIQTRHTTTGLVLNEHEPLLLEDLRRTLERAAPHHVRYAHDDFRRRRVNLVSGERINGHAHCQALLLPSSAAVNVNDAHLCLGRWQRVFFVELDGAQSREVSVMLLGTRA